MKKITMGIFITLLAIFFIGLQIANNNVASQIESELKYAVNDFASDMKAENRELNFESEFSVGVSLLSATIYLNDVSVNINDSYGDGFDIKLDQLSFDSSHSTLLELGDIASNTTNPNLEKMIIELSMKLANNFAFTMDELELKVNIDDDLNFMLMTNKYELSGNFDELDFTAEDIYRLGNINDLTDYFDLAATGSVSSRIENAKFKDYSSSLLNNQFFPNSELNIILVDFEQSITNNALDFDIEVKAENLGKYYMDSELSKNGNAILNIKMSELPRMMEMILREIPEIFEQNGDTFSFEYDDSYLGLINLIESL